MGVRVALVVILPGVSASRPFRPGLPRFSRSLGIVLAAGLLVRLLVATNSQGVVWDLQSYRIVSDALTHGPLHVYSHVNVDAFRWPYPPAYFAWIVTTRGVSDLSGLDFLTVIRIAPILADLGLAWLVQWWLGTQGVSQNARLASAATIALGPVFIAVSSFHGQLDAVAFLPALAGFACWERLPQGRRAVPAGVLIGLGAALKTVPGFMLLALLPTARDGRERVVLIAAGVGLPLLTLAPFLVADHAGVIRALQYHGAPGLGGLSLAVQPNLATGWLAGEARTLSPVSRTLFDDGTVLLAAAILPVAAALIALRTRADLAAVTIVLTLYVFGGNFFLQYLVWGLPLVVILGRWRVAAAIQLLLVPATVLSYLHDSPRLLVWIAYTVPILALLVASASALAAILKRITRVAVA